MEKPQTLPEAPQRRQQSPPTPLSRRQFLQSIGAAAAGLLAAGCRSQDQPSTVQTSSPPTSAPTPTNTPVTTPTSVPTTAPTSASAVAPFPAPRSQVAIAQAASYDGDLVRRQIRALLDGLGGLDDVVRPGDRVAIKVNLTGGTHFQPPSGLSATESYLTHPEVVRALCESLRDAGAGQLFIVEAVYDPESYPLFGYQEVAQALDVTLVDLNDPSPYNDFASAPVGEGWFIYQNLLLHHVLEEVDAFISVAKMKCHYNCGVTHAMKNLIGLVPVNHYRLETTHWWRSALHGVGDEAAARLPRVILDLNRARPIDLALIDGIKTGEGGEVPRGTFHPVQPGVLIAGKDAVATDAIATAVMGFDPTVEPPTAPFLRGDNYLNLAYELGLGTNRLQEIDIVGASIEDVRYPFAPSREM